MRAKIPALTEALVGRFAAHHGAVARAILDHIDFLDAAIARLDERSPAASAAFESAVTLLETIPGVARKTAETIVAETGADMARFPTATQLVRVGGSGSSEPRIRGQTPPSRNTQRRQLAPAIANRVGESSQSHQRHLPRCSIPPDRRPPRA